jgi:hypothetical protein
MRGKGGWDRGRQAAEKDGQAGFGVDQTDHDKILSYG